LETADAAQRTGRQVVSPDHLDQQRGRIAVGHDRSRCDPLAILRHHAAGAAGGDVDPRHGPTALDANTATPGSPGEGGGDLAGSADRHRKSELLTEAGEHPSEQTAARTVRCEIGVEGVAGEEQSGRLAVEHLFHHSPHRQQCQPGEVERAVDPGGPQQPPRRTDGGNGRNNDAISGPPTRVHCSYRRR